MLSVEQEFNLRLLLARAAVLVQEGTSNSMDPKERAKWKERQHDWLLDYGRMPANIEVE